FRTSRCPVLKRGICDCGPVTILTIKIHLTGRTAKIVFQMHGMIELDGSGIAASQAQWGEFRMVAVKARHGVREMRSGFGSAQVGMQLGATGVRSLAQRKMRGVFFVARAPLGGG